MVARKRSSSRSGRGRRTRRGRGKVWNWIKGAAGKVNNFLKSNKVISRAAPMLGSLGVPGASAIGTAAGALGYGRRRRHGRGPYRFSRPPFSAGRGYRRTRHRGRGTPGMGMTDPTTYPIATSMALPRF